MHNSCGGRDRPEFWAELIYKGVKNVAEETEDLYATYDPRILEALPIGLGDVFVEYLSSVCITSTPAERKNRLEAMLEMFAQTSRTKLEAMELELAQLDLRH